MAENSENLVFTLHQTHDMLGRCEDRVFGEHGLTAEQYSVLTAIKYLDEPVKITDVAHRLTRSINSISMIVDRMVKAGLVERTRDEKDRRVVHLAITNAAEILFEPAALAGWKFIQEIMSPLSYEDKQVLTRLLGTLQHEASKCLDSHKPVDKGN